MAKKPEKPIATEGNSIAVKLPEQKGLRTIADCEIMQRVSSRQPKLDVDRKIRAVEAYAQFGTYATAARAAGVCPQTIKNHMKEDPDFKEGMEIAEGEFRDKLELAAYTRAVEGWDEPVFSQKLGTQIGTIRRYSDGLLQFIMKKWMPDYREKVQTDINVTGGVLLLDAGAHASGKYEDVFKEHGHETYTPTSEIIDGTVVKKEEE